MRMLTLERKTRPHPEIDSLKDSKTQWVNLCESLSLMRLTSKQFTFVSTFCTRNKYIVTTYLCSRHVSCIWWIWTAVYYHSGTILGFFSHLVSVSELVMWSSYHDDPLQSNPRTGMDKPCIFILKSYELGPCDAQSPQDLTTMSHSCDCRWLAPCGCCCFISCMYANKITKTCRDMCLAVMCDTGGEFELTASLYMCRNKKRKPELKGLMP